MNDSKVESRFVLTRLKELAGLFFKLGVIGFGGPAAHIAMMEEETVKRRNWLSREYFLDLVGATNLIPGPNSTEMAIHIGFMRAGALGLVVAGTCFILPAVLITGFFAWLYVHFGKLPEAEPILFGIRPAVLAIIATAVWRLGKTAAKTWKITMIGILVLVLTLLGLSEIFSLIIGGILGTAWLYYSKPKSSGNGKKMAIVFTGLFSGLHKMSYALTLSILPLSIIFAVPEISLWRLGLFFLKVGSVLYGSGYVLVAFLEGGLVHQYGWLTQKQLLDAIAIGQFTPGPVLSTATFIGYLLAGVNGAIVSTVGIFLPSFIFVAILNPLVPKLRKTVITSAFLDAVNISAIALMVAICVKLSHLILLDWKSVLILILALVVSFRWKVNTFWVILGGAVLGWAISFL